MPKAIASSTSATATAYSNQRKIDRCSNGVLWAFYATDFNGVPGNDRVWVGAHSTDNGATWTVNPNGYEFLGSGGDAYTENASFFIDLDDYCHAVYKNNGNGFIYYRRGTPNAGRTAWTWSAATQVSSTTSNDYPDVVAHREGTGWRVHVVLSEPTNTINRVRYFQYNITSGGVISNTDAGNIATAYGNTVHAWPSIDFNHTGDGKTVAGGNPHLYVAWSAGTTGAGKGIRFKKATYSAGAWTWGTEREIDSTRYADEFRWLNCLFDGTRVIMGGMLFDSTSDRDIVLHERDATDTTTTTRVLLDNLNATSNDWINYGSLSYDSSGNVYLVGPNGAGNVIYRKWTRVTATLGARVLVSSTTAAGYASAKRGYSNNRIEFIYTDGTASPYEVKYSYEGDSLELPVITTSTASTATAYSNQRKIDRCQNGVLWETHQNPNAGSPRRWEFRYSTDNGATWTYASTSDVACAGTGTTYTENASFFIDLDDYAHVVYKDAGDGFIYYRRGAPNAARTTWTWSAALLVENGATGYDHPDIVAFREGTGWVAAVVYGYNSSSQCFTVYRNITIASGGGLTLGARNYGADSSVNYKPYPSIDFHHTGDGKTVKNGAPHLFVAWSSGTGSGSHNGIQFQKATYSGGSWTWGTKREIDSTRFVATATDWLNCMFDGARVVMTGLVSDGTNRDLILHERDAGDTTTTTRTLLDNTAAADQLFSGSASYDSSGNVYLVGRDGSGANGTRLLNWRKWTRSTATLGAINTVDVTASDAPHVSAKRVSGSNFEFIYTDKTASPFDVRYNRVGLNAPPNAPNLVSPTAGAIIRTALVSLVGAVLLNSLNPAQKSKLEYQFATDSGFSQNLRTVTEPNSAYRTNGEYTYKLSAGEALPKGLWYVRAKAIPDDGQPNSDWSSAVSFTVSHPPAAVNLTPTGGNGAIYGATNRLDWDFSDDYELDTQTAYRVVVERNDTGALVVDTAKVASVNSFYDVALSATLKEVQLRWRAKVWDSEDTESSWTPYSIFTPVDNFALSITSPLNNEIITSTTPTIVWDAVYPGTRYGVSYRVAIKKQGEPDYGFDSGTISGSAESYVANAPFIKTGNIYDITVFVTDNLGVINSRTVSVTAQYQEPTSVTWSVDTSYYENLGYIWLQWLGDSDPSFKRWKVYRRLAGKTWQVIAEIPLGAVTEYKDWQAKSQETYQYYVTQVVDRFGNEVESSVSSSTTVTTPTGGYWLIDPVDSNNNVRLHNVTSEDYTEMHEQTEYTIVGRGRHIDEGEFIGKKGTMAAQLRSTGGSSARVKKQALEALRRKKTPVYLRNPFGDLDYIALGDVQVTRVSGVGSSEFVDVSVPYSQVF